MRAVTVLLLRIALCLLPAVAGFTATRPPPRTTRSKTTSLHSTTDCDVLVLGSGPAGCAISSLLQAKGLDVMVGDANYDSEFVPNYGVWQDEWQAVLKRYKELGVTIDGGEFGDSLNRIWSHTDCFFGGSFDMPMTKRTRLDRPYCQVDRYALRASLIGEKTKVVKSNHISEAVAPNLYAPSNSLVHDEDGTTIVLQDKSGKESKVKAKLVVDTTGHETQLVLRDDRAPAAAGPGFQIAYGCLLDIDEEDSASKSFGPYDKECMTLFDYRTDHFSGEEQAGAVKTPTFMYVMPIKDNEVFFEETSLVARPGVSFQECKDRCFKRLEHLGIKVNKVLEEEYCYIPMGGALPVKDQRVIGLGGAAAMVHPSTGYHLCRMLMGAADMADAIATGLVRKDSLDKVAASAYGAIWSPETIRQRNFAVYGGEFLMKQDVVGLRGFFDGFFKLPLELWGGFLAGWPGLPNNDQHESWLARIWFGVNFLIRLPPSVALKMFTSIVTYSIMEGAPLPQSVTPFFGEPPSYDCKNSINSVAGDTAAKLEAKTMIMASKVTEEVPVAFEESATATKQTTAAAR